MILVNFGGPRGLTEVRPFLNELLTDQDVIRTRLPPVIHRWIFSRVAKKRALKISPDYQKIGGGSPIFRDTEEVAKQLSHKLSVPVVPFHRYLKATHDASFQTIEALQEKTLRVLPLFPQFSYATTGSIARFFSERLSKKTELSLRWIQSYAAHPAFIECYAQKIKECLQGQGIEETDAILLFSCHGLPRLFIDEGDVYEAECQSSFAALSRLFPQALCRLSYQSKFGRGEWLRPYTDEVCKSILSWNQGRKWVVIVPLSFTSDHIETLYEIEELYLPLVRKQGIRALRCPALNCEPGWIDALAEIAAMPTLPNDCLIRK